MDSPATHIEEVLKHISDLFTDLIQKIVKEMESDDIHKLRGEARFLFGGWDWRRGLFRVWELFYAREVEGILFNEITDDDTKTRFYTFLGNAQQNDFIKGTRKRFHKLLSDEDKLDSKLDMEPLKLLREIALDSSIREVGGSLQIAKVYKSSQTEFFGIAWPSSDSAPHFQGRKYHPSARPPVRYLNPDTFEIMELDLPDKISLDDELAYGNHIEFVRECYPDGERNENLSERDRQKIQRILKDVACAKFMEQQAAEEGQE